MALRHVVPCYCSCVNETTHQQQQQDDRYNSQTMNCPLSDNLLSKVSYIEAGHLSVPIPYFSAISHARFHFHSVVPGILIPPHCMLHLGAWHIVVLSVNHHGRYNWYLHGIKDASLLCMQFMHGDWTIKIFVRSYGAQLHSNTSIQHSVGMRTVPIYIQADLL